MKKLLLYISLLSTFVVTKDAFSMDFNDESGFPNKKTLITTLSQYGRQIIKEEAFQAGSSNKDLWNTTSIKQTIQNVLGIAPTSADITHLVKTLDLDVTAPDSNHFTAQFMHQNQTVISISFVRDNAHVMD